ncbi:MAG TPA: helix-turn-helix domain-containing protein [Ignavibacteria bacterium]|nr:helix-turn-helix domain-containing protein [Ignavibacteria bacterium]
MARIAVKITLSDKQEQILRSLSNSRTVSVNLQMRATILLHCSQGKTNLEIMEETGTHKKTISKWRKRWARNQKKLATIENQETGIAYQRQIEKVLSDDPRCGTPSKFTAEQICLIMNVACESPQENGLPLSHWSLSSLADE